MNIRLYLLSLSCLFACLVCPAQEASPAKPRVFILTDISNEPDDEESLIRFLVYCNEFDVEGIVANTSCFLREHPREDQIRRLITAYGQVHGNLSAHAPGFPTPQALEAVTATGQPGYGLASVGQGQSSPGSELLLKAAGKRDERPLWVCLWGGANTLAQALTDARDRLPRQELEQLVARLRVYAISDQDDAGPWIRREFPGLFYIVDPSQPDYLNFHTATWSGISGDRHYRNGVYYQFNLVDTPWLEANVIHGHGPLGAAYPAPAYIMEGDTPSFLGLINNGLGWTESPAYGGWGGRYNLYRPSGESRAIWTSNALSRDTLHHAPGQTFVANTATLMRWRKHFQHDFAARMDWCATDDYAQANHNPIAVANGDTTRAVIRLHANGRRRIPLHAAGSHDPDGDSLSIRWWIYHEASSCKGAFLSRETGEATEVCLPEGAAPQGDVHIILQLNDNGTPNLYAYRRIILTAD